MSLPKSLPPGPQGRIRWQPTERFTVTMRDQVDAMMSRGASMWTKETRYGIRVASALGVLLTCSLLGCDGKNADTEAGTDGGDTNWPAPELCEVRQREPGGEFEGPSDVQAICDEAKLEIMGLNRPQGVQCTTEPVSIEACPDGGECESDADCAGLGSGAKCAGLGGTFGCFCVIPCTSDADCSGDRACVCRSGVTLASGTIDVVSHTGCWPADCRSDADCGLDGSCVLSSPKTCPAIPHLRCQPADATCHSDLDCPDGEACALGLEGWQCAEANCGP
jgi:hypothetical protein